MRSSVTELKEDRIAPNITAAKKPRIGFGINPVLPASGNQESPEPRPVPGKPSAQITPGTTMISGVMILREACKYGALLCFPSGS